MKPERLLRAILPDVLIDNFDIVNFDKSADRFDIYLDEKKVQLKEDKTNPDIISYGFGEYRIIQLPYSWSAKGTRYSKEFGALLKVLHPHT